MEYNGKLYGFSAVKVKLVDSLIEDHSFSAEFVRWSEGKDDLKHLRVFILNNSLSQFPYFYWRFV